MRELTKTMFGGAALLGAMVLAGSAAAAQLPPTPDTDTGPTEVTPVEVVAKKDKVVCRSVRTTTSRMAVRVCETEGQKERRLASARDRQVKSDTEGTKPYSAARRGNTAASGGAR